MWGHHGPIVRDTFGRSGEPASQRAASSQLSQLAIFRSPDDNSLTVSFALSHPPTMSRWFSLILYLGCLLAFVQAATGTVGAE